ncbi:hypothetical protein AB0L25_23495 [Spirillospora sp. NPDC052242]
MLDAVDGVRDGRRPLQQDDLHGAVDVPGEGDEAVQPLVDVPQVGVVAAEGLADGVQGDVAVVQGGEVGGVGGAPLLAAPLVPLDARLHLAVDEGRGEGGRRADPGADQRGDARVHASPPGRVQNASTLRTCRPYRNRKVRHSRQYHSWGLFLFSGSMAQYDRSGWRPRRRSRLGWRG